MSMDGYTRVSRVDDRDGDSFISLDVQRDKIDGWAKAHDVEIGEVFRELDVSGGTLQRPELNKALERIADGTSEGLIVAKLDRLSRAGVADALTLFKTIEAAGGSVVAVADGIDPTTTTGKFARTLMLALAEMELDRVKENWATARRFAIDRGVFVGPTPIGYTRLPTGRTKKNSTPELGPLVIYEPDAVKVRELFQHAAGAETGPQAALAYLRTAFPERKTATITALEDVLSNRIYLGELKSGEFVKHFPELEIVDRLTFDFAQHARPVTRRTRLLPRYPLAGIATCGSCGKALSAHDLRGVRRLRCRNPECPDRVHVGAEALEVLVLDKIGADPPTASPDELLQRSSRLFVLSETLAEHITDPDKDSDKAYKRTAWQNELERLEEEFAIAQAVADRPLLSSLPDLDGDLSLEDRRRVFERALKKVVVRKGPGPLADRIDLVPHT
jgi:DNA invertase Pin-like site-specific DNA recombinase